MEVSLTEFIIASWDGYALQGKWIFTPPMVYSTGDVAMFLCSSGPLVQCFQELQTYLMTQTCNVISYALVLLQYSPACFFWH